MRIYIIGFMGSGKSTNGRRLAEKLNFGFIDLDDYIEQKHRHSISSIITLVGEEGFRKVEKSCLHEVSEKDNVVISTGGGAPCFFDNMETMNANGISVYLKTSVEALHKRLLNSKSDFRPLIKGKNAEELWAYIEESLAVRENFYKQAQVIIESDDTKPEDIVAILEKNGFGVYAG